MNHIEAKTTTAYWDSVWNEISDIQILQSSHFYFGRDGIFSKVVRRYFGDDLSNRRIVEIGGGGPNMRLLALAKWFGAEVTALDYSEQGLEVTARLFAANNCVCKLVNADFLDWAPDGQGFDHVVHWGVLEHFNTLQNFITKSAALMNAGGSTLFSMPNLEALAARGWRRWSPENWAIHIFHPTSEVEAELRSNGLVDFEAFHFGMPMVRAAPWEKRSAAQIPLDALQVLASGSARVLPIYHSFGSKWLSTDRGFFARRLVS